MNSQPGHIDQVKQVNAGAVYRLIEQYGPISRTELSKKSHLAPASITKIVREMLEADLLLETEFNEPGSRGRPAIGLGLHTHTWHFLAVDIGEGTISLALRELKSDLVVEQHQPLPPEADEPLQERIIRLIDGFFRQHQQKLERLTAISITLPGIVDTSRGIVRQLPYYRVQDMPLGATLEAQTGVPVYLQQHINAWALTESLFGAGRNTRDFIQLVIGDRVSAAVISDGDLLHGKSNRLTDIAHIQVDAAGEICTCGHRGCLNTVATIKAVLNQAVAAGTEDLPLSVEELCNRALAGDPLACQALSRAGSQTGRVLAMMVNLFQPQKILVASALNPAKSVFFPALFQAINQQVPPEYTQDFLIESVNFINPGTLAGATLIRRALYDGSLLIKLLQG